ncbi:MAG: type 11 methyltransferase [Bacteroidetes bacterium OLB12]|nr:MAG: type 11 methyltransferase [Bacteroidetes bacterium OLB12]
MLHVAPEVCFMKRFEKQHGARYITTDIESPLAKVKADIHQLPFADNTFDAVLCNHVLEHVADDIQAMREIKRVLKPGGWAILQVPFFSPVPETTFEDNTITDKREREKIFGQDDHVRKYGQDYASRINASGLVAEKNNFAQTLSKEIIARASIMENEVLYIGKKQSRESYSANHIAPGRLGNFFTLPILFLPGPKDVLVLFTGSRGILELVRYALLIGYFYFNYHWLVPRYYFSKKYSQLVLLTAGMYFLIVMLPGIISPSTPAFPAPTSTQRELPPAHPAARTPEARVWICNHSLFKNQ